MASLLPLPLPAEELPQSIRRFCDPAAPVPARTMAAKGLVPVKGADLVTLLVLLAADKEVSVAETAAKTLVGVPEAVLHGACEAPLHASVLHALAERFSSRSDVIERIVANHGTAARTVEKIAATADEKLCERIATNEQRLLEAPTIIEALYKNKNMRMSTADRLVELAARNGVELKGIPAFQAHVEAIQGQLIPEPTDEPLPTDVAFQETLRHDDDDAQAIEQDVVDGTETLKEQFKPLSNQIAEMAPSEKIRLALVGSAAIRAILVRDSNKQVAHAAISSPMMSEAEAAAIAHSKQVAEDILRFIGNRKEWLRNYEVKRALVFNPKTPVGISLRFVGHMRDSDLKQLARSRNVPVPVKTAAAQQSAKKEKQG